MKRLLLIAGLAIAAIGFSAGPVLADSGNGSGTTVAHYTVSYVDPFFGPVTCTGVHQAGKNNFPGTAITGSGTWTDPYMPTSGRGGEDSFTCTSTTGLPLTNVTSGESLSLATLPYGIWLSDFIPLGAEAASSFTGKVTADGFSYTAVAIYPFP
jgi:hypothetical protein